MRSFLALSTALLAATLGHAIRITSPSRNDEVDLSKGVTVEWETVSTDPERAHLVLVNMAPGNTPFERDLGEVRLSTGRVRVVAFDVPPRKGYQFNFQSVEKDNTGILAQSEQFEVDDLDTDNETDDEDNYTRTRTPAAPGTTAAPTTLSTAAAAPAPTATTAGTDRETSAGTGAEAAETSTSTGAAPAATAVGGGSLVALAAGALALMV